MIRNAFVCVFHKMLKAFVTQKCRKLRIKRYKLSSKLIFICHSITLLIIMINKYLCVAIISLGTKRLGLKFHYLFHLFILLLIIIITSNMSMLLVLILVGKLNTIMSTKRLTYL